MNRRKRPLVLGVITAIPIAACFVCFLCVLILMLNDIKIFGIVDVAFFVSAGLAVSFHLVMFFYYLIKMQNLKSINDQHYLLWLLVLMALGGQLVFWYLFCWKSDELSLETGTHQAENKPR